MVKKFFSSFAKIFAKFACLRRLHRLRGHGVGIVVDYADSVSEQLTTTVYAVRGHGVSVDNEHKDTVSL